MIFNIDCDAKLFADDTQIYKDIDSPTSQNSLQENINKLLQGSKEWLLKFNISKCHVLHLGKNHPQYEYYMQLQDNNF